MRIGILGSGLMGGKLGMIFARAGHEVVFSYSHSDGKLKKLARDAGGRRSEAGRQFGRQGGRQLLPSDECG
jgi:8-hydroxy-5-deazaflavin:NADPH oxidoreductase